MLVTSLLVKGSIAAATAVTAGAVGFAQLSTPANSTPGTTSGRAAATAHVTVKLRTVLRRFEHGEFTVARKSGSATYDAQRGRVTSISATSLVVTSGDGFEGDYAVSTQTRIRVDKRRSNASAVHVGDQIAVLASDGKAIIVTDRQVPTRTGAARHNAQPNSPRASAAPQVGAKSSA